MRSRFGRGQTPPAITPADEGESLTASREADNERISRTTGDEDELPRPPDSAPIRPDLGPPAPGPQSAYQPGSGLGLIVSIAIAAVVFVLAIYAAGSPTENPLPLAQTTNALFWGVAAVVTAAAGAGASYADRTASRAMARGLDSETFLGTAWIVPAISTATAVLLVATFHNTTMIVIGPLIAFLGNAGSLLSRDLLDDADDSAQRTATTIHTLVVHAIAFLALSAVYLNKLPTPVTALAAGLIAALLTVETLDRSFADPGRRVAYAILAGGAVAAVSVPLMWWLTHGWTGGAVLFVAFYCAVGILQTVVDRGAFRMRDAVEYGVVPFAALILLAVTA